MRCRHLDYWILGRGSWFWCWQCGAIRRNGWPRWVPVADQNPALVPWVRNMQRLAALLERPR